MSKAFTRESDDSDAEELPSFRPQLPPGTRNYITPEGAARLKRRLDALLDQKRTLRPSEGDRRKLEASIRNLQQLLDSVVIAERPVDREKAAFGATVVVRHANGQEDSYRIVGVVEADPEHGSISWLSPLGRALLSRKAGDKVRFRSPEGDEELAIVSVAWPTARE